MLLGAAYVSNPQQGSRTERRGFGLLSHTSCMLHPTRLRLLSRTSCALILAVARRSLRFESPAGESYGEKGIRTPGTFRYATFPRLYLKPLGHLSKINDWIFCFRDFTFLRTLCALFLALLGVASVSNPHKDAKRREGDSNPRILADQRFSRPPDSTALASLQSKCL